MRHGPPARRGGAVVGGVLVPAALAGGRPVTIVLDDQSFPMMADREIAAALPMRRGGGTLSAASVTGAVYYCNSMAYAAFR